jgi:hypothetical protein
MNRTARLALLAAAGLGLAGCGFRLPENRWAGFAVADLSREPRLAGGLEQTPGIIEAPPPDPWQAPVPIRVRVVPLPSIGHNPDAGTSYGTIVPLLCERRGIIATIFAPSLTYNPSFGVDFTFRALAFRQDRRRFHLELAHSTEGNEQYSAGYELPDLPGGFDLAFEAGYETDHAARFYGLGNSSLESGESRFASRDLTLSARVDYHLIGKLDLRLVERFRIFRPLQSVIQTDPFVGDRWPAVPGTNGSTQVWGHRVGLVYDSRDSRTLTTRGLYAEAAAELVRDDLSSDQSFIRLEAEARYFFQLGGTRARPRTVNVLRANFSYLDSDGVSFIERAGLGSREFMRGLSQRRFVDDHLASLSVESRVRLGAVKLFGVETEPQLAFFYETGQVAGELRDFELSRLKQIYGFGVRIIVRPNIVGRLDVGFSGEGPAVYLALGMPF